MILIDVNVLVYAYREDSPNHPAFRNWLSDLINSGEPFGVAALALSGFLRITTHPKIFNPPSPPEDAWRAMAIEAECEWITTDGDFSLFPGLRWRRLLS